MKVRVSALLLSGAVVAALCLSQPLSRTPEYRFRTIIVKHSDLQISIVAMNGSETLTCQNVLVVPNAALQFQPRSEQVVAPPPQLSVKENIFGDRLADEASPLSDVIGNFPLSVESTFQDTFGPKPDQPCYDTIWALDASRNHVYPIAVVLGLSNGVYTEVVGKDIQEGTEIVTAEVICSPAQVTAGRTTAPASSIEK